MTEMAPPEAMAPDPLIGERISHYIVVKCLARGGMGIVYFAVHHDPELQHVHRVIKLLLPDCARRPDIVRRFKGEAAIAAQLQHHNICEVYEFGVHGDQCYLVLPFLKGAALDTLLDRQPGHRLTEHRALRIILQIAAALAHAHAARVIHRDLKPGNVFIVPSDDNPELVKVIDFGIAKRADASEEHATRTGAGMGTPGYMAPEQYLFAAKVTPQADVFALGVMAFEMVTGRLPWPDSLPFEAPQLPDPATMSPFWPAFWHVLSWALATDPAARWASVGEFAIALASTLTAVQDWPSGEEMLGDFTSFTSFKRTALGVGVRGAPHAAAPASPFSWPAAPVSLPTKNELPPGQRLRTTLTAASGVFPAPVPAAVPSTSGRRSRLWATVAALVGTTVVAAVITTAIRGAGEDPAAGRVTDGGSGQPTRAAHSDGPVAPAASLTADAPAIDAGLVDADAMATEEATANDPARPDAEPTTKGSRTKRAATSKTPPTRAPRKAHRGSDDVDPEAIGGEE